MLRKRKLLFRTETSLWQSWWLVGLLGAFVNPSLRGQDQEEGEPAAEQTPSETQNSDAGPILQMKLDWTKEDSIVTIRPGILDASSGAVWSLAYSPFSKSIEQSKSIIMDQPVSREVLEWNVADMEEGLYHIYGVIKDRNLERLFFASEPLIIDKSSRPGNRSPYLRVEEPDEMQLFIPGDNLEMRFIAKDLEGDPLTYNLQAKCSNEEEWRVLLENFIPEEDDDELTVELLLGTPIPRSSRCEIQVVADDGDREGRGSVREPVAFAPGIIRFADIQQTLNNNCASCHTGEDARSNFRVDSEDDILNPDGSRAYRGVASRIDRVVDYINRPLDDEKHMPPGRLMNQVDLELMELYRLSREREE